ncbi:MAG: ABC transporter permease [Bacteroidetes bacterium]|nr:ABC transporter permease [Bacteroidota bacterium]MBS1929633.1 ABC transporter permease [Bacteroidota bacterium]
MNNLIRTEWLKIKKYKAFWGIIGLTALSYPGISYIFHNIYENFANKKGETAAIIKALIGNPFSFPEVWHTLAFSSSLFVFIPSVVVIMFITNEYTYKTNRQNIIDGWSRNQFMASKLIDVLLVSLLVTFLYIAICLITGFTSEGDGSDIWGMAYYSGLFALQTFAQLSIAFLVGFLIRKAFIALGVFMFYFIVFEPILVGLAKWKANDIGEYLPLEISDRLIPMPAFMGRIDKEAYEKALASINIHILYTVILTSFVWWICFKLNNRRDL